MHFGPEDDAGVNPAAPDTRLNARVRVLTEALEEAQRLLAFAGCPTDWIDKVLHDASGVKGPEHG